MRSTVQYHTPEELYQLNALYQRLSMESLLEWPDELNPSKEDCLQGSCRWQNYLARFEGDGSALLEALTPTMIALLSAASPQMRSILWIFASSPYPQSTPCIAKKLSLPIRQVNTQVHRLIKNGWVVRLGGGQGRRDVRYDLRDPILQAVLVSEYLRGYHCNGTRGVCQFINTMRVSMGFPPFPTPFTSNTP